MYTMNPDNLFPTVYITYPRKCALVRCQMKSDRAVKECAFSSAEQAWEHWLSCARSVDQPRPDPADFIVVSGALTNDVNRNGAHLVLLDWQHTCDPQGFYEEVERERREAEVAEVAAAVEQKRAALVDLLLRMFSIDELRRFIRFYPGGKDLSLELPGPTESPLKTAKSTVEVLAANNMLDASFFDRLIAERPRREREIRDVQAMFGAAS